MTTTNSTHGYALVGSDSKIISLHDSRESADDAGWGRDRELVQLVRSHSVGDEIEYSDRGIEI